MEWEVGTWIASARSWVTAQPTWEAIKDFGNSTFFTSIAGAFAGAWAGGRIAQVLATRAKNKEELEREIRKANAAAIMSSAICDELAGMLRQHVRPMKERYDSNRAEVKKVLAAKAPPSVPTLTIEANLMQLSKPSLSVEHLEQLIFGEVSNIRVTRLSLTLRQTVSNVHSTVQQHNSLVEEFRSHPHQQVVVHDLYFGFPDARGRTDARYQTTLDSLHTALWDGVYFSMHLALNLAGHASDLERHSKKTYGGRVPQAIQMDFSRLSERGLMPDSRNYADWEELVSVQPKQTFVERIAKRLQTAFSKK